jgi:hypothetical protein
MDRSSYKLLVGMVLGKQSSTSEAGLPHAEYGKIDVKTVSYAKSD